MVDNVEGNDRRSLPANQSMATERWKPEGWQRFLKSLREIVSNPCRGSAMVMKSPLRDKTGMK